MRRRSEHGVDGVILCPAAGTEPGFPVQVKDWGLPLVQVLRHVTEDADYAGVDYAAGICEAVDYLASLGHRRVAFAVHGPVHSANATRRWRSEEHTSELQSLMRISYAVFCLKKTTRKKNTRHT